MNSKSDNIEFMINDEANEAIEGLFKLLQNRYQNNLKSMKNSEFAFDYVCLLHYECHKDKSQSCGSYIDSPNWIKKQ